MHFILCYVQLHLVFLKVVSIKFEFLKLSDGLQVVNGAGGSITCSAVRRFGLSAALSGDKRPEESKRGRHGALPLLFSMREAGRERVLERCGGLNGTS